MAGMQWSEEAVNALLQRMRGQHPNIYVLHNHWHQAVPVGTLRKHSLRLFYEHNLRERCSPVECRQKAEEILVRMSLSPDWLHEPWQANDSLASYYWSFMLAFLLKPRDVLILAKEEHLPATFTSVLARLRDEGAAIMWCEHA